MQKKNKIVLEWVILILLLLLILPLVNTVISKSDEKWINFLIVQIKFIDLPAIFGLLFYQIWRFKKNERLYKINTVYKDKN